MDTKQIVTLAVIFVAGLVLGNIAGNVTGYGTKALVALSVSPAVVTMDASKTQSATVTVDVKSGTIKQKLELFRTVTGASPIRKGYSNNVCTSSNCGAGKYTTTLTVPNEKGDYFVQAVDRAGNNIATASFKVQ